MNDASPSADRLAIVLKGWPRLSETFIAQELVALEHRGLAFEVWSLRRPTDRSGMVCTRRCGQKSTICPEYLYEEPLRVLRGAFHAARLPGFRAAARLWLGHLRRDPTPNRIRRLGQAMVLAREAPLRTYLSLRALPAHALVGGSLHEPAQAGGVGFFGARQGYLAVARLGKARQAGARRIRRDMHGARGSASARAGRRSCAARPRLSRPRPVALSGAACPTSAARRFRRARRPLFGRPPGREEGLYAPARGACDVARSARLAVRACRRRRASRGACRESREAAAHQPHRVARGFATRRK